MNFIVNLITYYNTDLVMLMNQRKIGKKLLITLVISLIVCSALWIGRVSSNAPVSPSQIEIFVGPPSLPADNGTYKCVFVELQDADGNPARAQQDTTISLSSSRTEIGTVDSSISIPAGATFGAANFYATFTSGNTMIAAAATGYPTVQAQVTTVGPKPYTIAVYGFPATLPADGGSYEAVVVQLQDVHGSPARAPKGGTQVYLSCSNTVVGDVTSSVTIPEGQTYAKATFQTTTTPGEATITSIAGDYISSNTVITTQELDPYATPDGLSISTGSPKVLADNSAYDQIAVQLRDENGNLVAAPSDITVTIASSDQSIGRTETHLTIPRLETYALATFHSTYKAGTTNITAAATNLIATQQPFNTTGFTASALAVYCVPSKLAADNGGYQIVQVQLQDADGNPAQAPDTDLNVKLFSSNPTVGLVSSQVTIPLGKTWATGTLTTTNSSGTTTITAQASSYTPGQAEVTAYTIDFASLHVTVTSEATQVPNGNDTTITAYITAQGKPVTGAAVTFTSDNGGTFTETQEEPAGYYTTIFTAPIFTNTTTCTITANASITGFMDSRGTVQVAVGPTVSTTTTSTPTLLLRILDDQGDFLVDVLVSSTAQPAGVAAVSGVTNETGDVAFQNLTAGSYVFQISKDGYATLEQPVEYTGKSMALVSSLQTGSGQGDNTWILVGIIVVFAVVFTVIGIGLVKRRRKQPTKGLAPLNWPTSTH